jgi:hypothetical protein
MVTLRAIRGWRESKGARSSSARHLFCGKPTGQTLRKIFLRQSSQVLKKHSVTYISE